MHHIFDLDLTVIDSTHRKATLPDGSLDLDHWIENNTAEKIRLDSILPAAKMMRAAYYSGRHTVIVCTARVLGEADYAFFMEHNLPYHFMLDRPLGCTLPDVELKDIQLRLWAHNNGLSWSKFISGALIIDDNQAVLERMKSLGLATLDAIELNRTLLARASNE